MDVIGTVVDADVAGRALRAVGNGYLQFHRVVEAATHEEQSSQPESRLHLGRYAHSDDKGRRVLRVDDCIIVGASVTQPASLPVAVMPTTCRLHSQLVTWTRSVPVPPGVSVMRHVPAWRGCQHGGGISQPRAVTCVAAPASAVAIRTGASSSTAIICPSDCAAMRLSGALT
jgi:hypothetical protein